MTGLVGFKGRLKCTAAVFIKCFRCESESRDRICREKLPLIEYIIVSRGGLNFSAFKQEVWSCANYREYGEKAFDSQ